MLPPRTLLLDVAGPLEVLRRANRVQNQVRFEVTHIGPTKSVTSSIGIELTGLAPLPSVLPSGAMVVLAGDVDAIMNREDEIVSAADSAAETRIVDWLRTTIQPTHKLICICSGSLLAARAGLLDGYACTTHYLCCSRLAKLASKARVLENRLYVEDGERFTSAGVTAGIDLMLHLISRIINYSCALDVARYLVVYLRRSGADPQLSPWLEGRNHIHPSVHRVRDIISAEPTKSWTLQKLARIIGASPRHLSRLFNQHTGMSITEYSNRLRIALAQEMISNSRLDMEQVAERTGFSSSRQFRRAWRRIHLTPPARARQVQQSLRLQ